MSSTACIGILRRARKRGKHLPYILEQALVEQAIGERKKYGEKEISHTIETLRILWSEIGAESFKEWVRRISLLVQQEKILLCAVCKQDERQENGTETHEQSENKQTESKENCSFCTVCGLWKSGLYGSTSQGQEPSEQLKRELDSIVQEMSLCATPKESLVLCLWRASEGIPSMFEALSDVSEIQEEWQGTSRDSSDSIGKSSERECIAFEPGLAKRDGSENRFVENCSPTIRANMGDNQTAVAYTLQIRSGCEGGGKGPLIQTDKSACLTAAQTQTLFQPFCIQGSVIGRKDENGPQGDGINSDKAFTLNTIDRHAVAYGICSAEGGGTGVCEGCVLQPVAFRKTAHPRTADEGQGWEETTVNDTLNIFDSGETRTPTLVCEPIIDGVIDVETEVYERKYKVDCKLLCECLREHKIGLSISNKEISEQLNVPLTMVEHWFRQDKSFSIPDADIWFKLKELLGIQTDEFDEAITTFIAQPGKYDMGNRIYVGDISPTLTTQSSDYKYLLPLSIENHPNDSRMGIREDGTVQTLTGRMETGGGNVPLVAEPKTYGMTVETFFSVEEDKAPTLKARDYKDPQAVCYAIDRASFNQGENAQYDFQINDDEIAQTLVSKGPGAVSYYENIKYIVRRLTPTECARLQGMPDMWCRLSQIEDMSDEDYEFWKQAHKTYAEINGKKYKEKTKKQMITWYNKLQVDSAEYKAYGNGMALPCVRVPIHGIAKHGAKTMASLFDGIGGFPLAGLIDGIETLWTSEIELFPIAVTMERFREYEKYGCFTFGCDGRFE